VTQRPKGMIVCVGDCTAAGEKMFAAISDWWKELKESTQKSWKAAECPPITTGLGHGQSTAR